MGPWLVGARFSLIFNQILIKNLTFWRLGWSGLDFHWFSIKFTLKIYHFEALAGPVIFLTIFSGTFSEIHRFMLNSTIIRNMKRIWVGAGSCCVEFSDFDSLDPENCDSFTFLMVLTSLNPWKCWQFHVFYGLQDPPRGAVIFPTSFPRTFSEIHRFMTQEVILAKNLILWR